MKKYFTNLSKYYSAIIISVTMLVCSFSASAEEYKSMIRYDRVWEHISIYWNDRQVYYVKFDGPEEINGKTYHRLVAFRKASYDYNADSQPYLFDIDDNYYQHEGYMREEGGKVYTLVARILPEMSYVRLALYTPDIDFEAPYELEERLLYDFTCDEGESYKGIHSAPGEAEEMDYKVKSLQYVKIDNEDCRLMRVETYDDWYGCWNDLNEPIVEGIGITSYGCLTTINFMWLPSCPCMSHMFNRVLSTDGRVLYRTEDGCAEIPVNDFLGVNGIVEIIDRPETSAPIYDILGRRISAPAPGQLYIRNGRKHIAK